MSWTQLIVDVVEVPQCLSTTFVRRHLPLSRCQCPAHLPCQTTSLTGDVLRPMSSTCQCRRRRSIVGSRPSTYLVPLAPVQRHCRSKTTPIAYRRSMQHDSCTGCRRDPTDTSTCSRLTVRTQSRLCRGLHHGGLVNNCHEALTSSPARRYRIQTSWPTVVALQISFVILSNNVCRQIPSRSVWNHTNFAMTRTVRLL